MSLTVGMIILGCVFIIASGAAIAYCIKRKFFNYDPVVKEPVNEI